MRRLNLFLMSYLITILTAFNVIAQTASQPVQYSLTLDPDGTYKVWMKSMTGYTGNAAKISTAQVSLVVPTGTNFTVSNLTSANGMSWTTTSQSRINNPSVSGTPTGKDYIVFNYANSTNLAFDIAANTDIQLFSFKNSSPCNGAISLWGASDVYQVPNADNFNVGNQITIFGAGFGNKWNSNYGSSPVPCNAPPTPDLQVSVTPPATVVQNSLSVFGVNVSNSGTGPTTGTTTVTTPIPAGMTYNGSSGAGWTCNQVASDVVCTNTNPISAPSNSGYNLLFTPTQAGASSISSTVSGGGDATPSTSTPSNFTVSSGLSNCLVEYKITLEADGSYKVWMKSNTSFSGTAATIGTAQVTVVFPMPSGSSAPSISNLTGFNSMTWNTSAAQQVQQGNFYYVTFNFNQASSPTVFNITSGQDIPLFSFKNTATCNGAISLWASTDAFQVPNALNFNVGNQISINGAGIGNKWCSNYGTAAACPPVATSPNITVNTTAPSTATVGSPFAVNVNVSNTGTGATTQPLSVSTPIPACMTYTSSTGAGWSCSVQTTNVVCNHANSIIAGGSAPLSLNFTPTQTCTTSISTTTSGGGLANPVTSTTQPITVNNNPTNPVLAVSITAPATATQNVPYNYAINVSNTGTSPTTGTTTVTLPLPAGFNYSSVSGSGWTCGQSGTNVICNNPNPIANGSSSSLSVAVTPTVTGTISTFAYGTGGGTTTTAFSTLVSTTITSGVATQPNIVIGTVTNPSSGSTGSPIGIVISINNNGTAPSSGTLTFVSTLPVGVNFSTASNGWTCTQVGQQLTCTSSTPINNGSSMPLSIQLVASSPISFTFAGNLTGVGVTSGAVIGIPIIVTTQSSGCSANDCGQGVRYGIKLESDGKTYTVYMKSATAFMGGAARISTAQVTLRVPHGIGTNKFIPINLSGNAATNNMIWSAGLNNRVDAPSADPANDYIFFGYSAVSNPNVLFDIFPNVEYPLFSFQNQNNCNGGNIALWETTDLFQQGSQSLNPGNAITILGNGNSNAWQCNYTCYIPCVQPADLSISATQPTPSLSVGQQSTINVTVTNLSANSATGQLTVTTTLPNGVTTPSTNFTSGSWTCNRVGQNVTCTNPNTAGLAQNATSMIALPVIPSASNAGQFLTFTFNVNSTSTDSNMGNNSTSITTTVPVSAPNLTISIPAFSLYSGQASNVNVIVSNTGSVAANGQLSVNITIPNGSTAPAMFSSNGWTCTTAGQTITCTHPNSTGLAQNGSSTIVVPVSIPANAVSGQTVIISANVIAIVGESNTNDNSASGSGQVISGVSLKLFKTASAIATQGNPFDFVMTVANTGGTNTSGMITVTDTLRNGLKFVSSTSTNWTCSKTGVDAQSNDIVQCTSSLVHLANATNTSNFTIRVNPTLATTASNTAYISGGGSTSSTAIASAPCSSCNPSATLVFIQPAPDLTVVILQPNPVFVVGQPSSISITINNTGGVIASSPLTVNITLPVGISMPPSFTTSGWNCTTAGQIVTCTHPNTSGIPVGGSTNINLIVTPPISLVGTTPTIIVSVLPIAGEVNTGNNIGTIIVNVPVAAPIIPDLAVSITMPSPALIIGQQSFLPITVTNVGTGSATGQLTVTMPIPAGISMSSGIFNGWNVTVNGNLMTATHANFAGLAVGGTLTFSVGITPNNTIINTLPTFIATVNFAPNEINGLNNTSMITVNVGVGSSGTPNLTITAVLSGGFVVNQSTNINVTVMNAGTVSATGQLTVTVTLPNGMTAPSVFTVNGWTGTTSGQTITLVYPNASGLLAGGILTFQIPITPSSILIGTVPSTIILNITQVANEVVFIDNTFYLIPSVVVLGNSGPNISVNVISLLPSLTVGQPSNITISFVNNGTQPQVGTQTIHVVIPNGISVPSSFTTQNGWTCNLNGQTLTCTNPNTGGLQPSSNINIIIPITPSSSLSGLIPAPITIFVNGGTNPIIYTFTTPVAASPAPNLSISVIMPPTQMIVGQTTYIPVSIINIGSVNAAGSLTVNITLPNGMTAPATFIQSGWTCTTVGQTITCTHPNTTGIITGGSSVILVPVTPSSILVGTTPSITINVLPVQNEVIVINNTFIHVITPAIISIGSPDLQIIVSQPSPAFVANQTSTINITINNIGSAAANGQLTVTFNLPANFTTQANTFMSGAWTCNVVGQTVTCTNPNTTGLAVGANVALQIQLIPSSAAVGSTISVNINVQSIIGEVSIGNNSTILVVSVPVAPDPSLLPNLNLVITYNQSATYYQNTPFNLSFLVYNGSMTTASNGTITVRDTLRYGLKFVSGTGSGWTINKVGVDAQNNDIIVATFNGALASSASTVFTLNVNPTLAGTIYNQGFISGGSMIVIKGSAPCVNCQLVPTGPIIISQALSFNVAVKAILQGAYVSSANMMHDSLRVKNLIPLNNPYTSMSGFTQVGSGTESTSSTVLAVTGNNAIVDWVLVELRSASNPSQIVATKAGLIQRDGDIVSASDGTSPLQFTTLTAGNYYVALRHRNHLGAMSASPITTTNGSTATLDLTNAAQPAYKLSGSTASNYPQFVSGSKAMLWAGNTTSNNQLIFQGPGNDVDGIFFTVISDPLNTQVISNFIHRGYSNADVNMDGKTVFQGPQNEVDIIFFNVLTHPENPGYLANYIIWQQIP
jgi:uncharacterized repeat protein (TIGR01451 family)